LHEVEDISVSNRSDMKIIFKRLVDDEKHQMIMLTVFNNIQNIIQVMHIITSMI